MPRPRQNTMQITFRIDVEVLAELKQANPSIFAIEPGSGKIKFGHGMLRKYLTRLIRADIAQRNEHKQKSLEERFKL